MEHSWWSAGEGVNSMFIYRKKGSPQGTIILTDDTLLGSVPPSPLTPHWRAFLEPRSSYLRLRCAGALQGPKNLRWLMGAEGGHLFTASSHGRICNVGKAKCQDGLSQYTVSSLLLSALFLPGSYGLLLSRSSSPFPPVQWSSPQAPPSAYLGPLIDSCRR